MKGSLEKSVILEQNKDKVSEKILKVSEPLLEYSGTNERVVINMATMAWNIAVLYIVSTVL